MRNDLTANFSQVPVFQTKSILNPLKRQPALEMFLSQLEGNLLSTLG